MPIRKTDQQLAETHVVGQKTQQWVVRVEKCPVLRIHQISHVGIAEAAEPYSMVRTNLNGTYMLACFSGVGRILLDGRWQTCKEGMACLAPPHVLHAFQAIQKMSWGFCWVKYEQPTDQKPVITSSSPVMAAFDPEPLRAAIWGLYHESQDAAEPTVLRHWVDLIQTYVLRFAQPWHLDDRLWKLWEGVEHNLHENWTLTRLSKECHVSGEHLRRLCRQQLGRSPMHHVIYLRMQKAASMLEQTEDKIESIARAVGYENPFVFSNTFKKWIGWRPSDYRRKKTVKG